MKVHHPLFLTAHVAFVFASAACFRDREPIPGFWSSVVAAVVLTASMMTTGVLGVSLWYRLKMPESPDYGCPLTLLVMIAWGGQIWFAYHLMTGGFR